MSRRKPLLKKSLLLMSMLSLSTASVADDTDILFSTCNIDANILFVLDDSTSMDGTPRQQMQDALKAILQTPAAYPPEFNMSLMGFMRNGETSRFIPMKNLADSHPGHASFRDYMINDVLSYGDGGHTSTTPIVDSLMVAGEYMLGGPNALVSNSVIHNYIAPGPERGHFNSHNPESGIENYIVLLTDGAPTRNNVHQLDSGGSVVSSVLGNMPEISSCASQSDRDGVCGPEITQLLKDKGITTFVIGFNTNGAYLNDLATNEEREDVPGQKYYEATNTTELIDAFSAILTGLTPLAEPMTFAPPGISVDSSGLSHVPEVYFTLFEPDAAPHWVGNLKKYGINDSGQIVDANNNSAFDVSAGDFYATAKSYWSASADGDEVRLGGAASKIPAPSARKLYYSEQSGGNAGAFSTTNNALKTRIQSVSPNINSDAEAVDFIKWAQGEDIKDVDNDASTTLRHPLADAIHSTPVVVQYDSSTRTVFYGDNEGWLRAVNADTGVEEFAVLPYAKIEDLTVLYDNDPTVERPYGIDGYITPWITDVDGDGNIEAADGDKVMLYVTMRRGDRRIYGYDVTDKTNPKRVWYKDESHYSDMGFTWPKPIKTKVKIKIDTNEVEKDVLVLSGGYDEQKDDPAVAGADSHGNAVYMLDAADGSKLWSAGDNSGHDLNKSDMKYSIPAGVRVIDVNRDGLADQFYVGDTGGQVWRFEITQGEPKSSLVKGHVIAKLGDNTAGSADNRRFFHTPDVSVVNRNGSRALAVAIGSGNQPSPMDTSIADRFYVLFLDEVTSALVTGSFTVFQNNNDTLYNASANDLGSTTDATREAAETALASASGWYINLATGEKVLSSGYTFNGALYFSTYVPGSDLRAICNGDPLGKVLLYSVDISDATPTGNLDPSDTTPSRFEELKTPGIPTTPTRHRTYSSDGTANDVICVGTECTKVPEVDPYSPTFWYEQD
jgi:type IV pilus assembly protein PilY1